MILFTGDLNLGQEAKIHKNVQYYITNSKYVVSNFENVLENENSVFREDKSSCLTYSDNTLKNYLKESKCENLFSLANNHIHDKGVEGLKNTYENLESYSRCTPFGIDNLGGTYKIIKVENDNKLGILTGSTYHPEVMSITEDKNGNKINDIYSGTFFKMIEDIKKQVDFLVVYVHWGKEYLNYPKTDLRLLSYSWIDNGADLIIGHHPHVLQGVEHYKGKQIFYSLGNFIFPEFYYNSGFKHKWKEENNRSIMIKLDPGKLFKTSVIGTIYNQKSQTLMISKKSEELFHKYSDPLNKLTLKEYYILFEKKEFLLSKKKFSKIQKFKGIFQMHRRYGIAGVFILKLKKIFNEYI